MADLIVGFQPADGGEYITVGDLSPAGHKFLADVRQDNIWNSTKEIAAKVGSKSLDTLIQISSNVITELIKAHIASGIPGVGRSTIAMVASEVMSRGGEAGAAGGQHQGDLLFIGAFGEFCLDGFKIVRDDGGIDHRIALILE